MLRSLLISYLYDLSERRTEVYLNENLPAKWFAGLAIDQKAPDHPTLSVYRERLQKRGVRFGAIQIIDSVHSEANVNTDKDDRMSLRIQMG